jgi:hypothetical protein
MASNKKNTDPNAGLKRETFEEHVKELVKDEIYNMIVESGLPVMEIVSKWAEQNHMVILSMMEYYRLMKAAGADTDGKTLTIPGE